MPLMDAAMAIDKTVELRHGRAADRDKLDEVRRYWTGRQSLPDVLPKTAPREVKLMAAMSRVNVCAIVVESLAQSLFVEGFRGLRDDGNAAVWDIWQANRLDARQTGIHRAAIAYGAAYAIVLPGDPVPVIRGASPRRLFAVYADDAPDWPRYALEKRTDGAWRLYDDTAVYTLVPAARNSDKLELLDVSIHGVGVTPVVRYRETEDLDDLDDVTDQSYSVSAWTATDRLVGGQVAPLMSIQDQVDVITFNLLVAEHFSAFRQRYILGWVAEDEKAKLDASASKLWTFDDPDVKIGELSETSLDGYIKSREASLRHAASLSQTPAHELIGEMVNISGEALAAAEAGRDRKVADRQTLFGESHEQTLRLAGQIAGTDIPDGAQVIWRDTSARTFAATVDALGKLATMLGVPPSELWDRIPGVSQQDVERWKAKAATGDALANLTAVLQQQATL